MVPQGAIVMWSGNPSAIPDGWALCDGANGTPDLRGRFIVGYNPSDSDYNSVGNIGGAKTHSHSLTGRTDIIANPSTGAEYLLVENTTGGLADCDSGTSPMVWRLDGGTPDSDYNHGNCAYYVGISGTADSTDQRPPYFTLAYIMRL